MDKKTRLLYNLQEDYDHAVKAYRTTGSNKALDEYAKSFIKLQTYKDILNELSN